MTAYPLLEAHPRLAAALPRAGLLAGATPVERLADAIWLKRDDLSAPDFGGNKVRKLDLLLAQARERGAREVLTFGYAGSNFVAATAWHGRKLGLATHAYLLPQVNAGYVADNLAVGLHARARLHLLPSEATIAAAAIAHSASRLLRTGRWPAWIPPGGSSPLGTVGFVNGAFELAAQVASGAMPVPDVAYVAFSSMGTVAGLALGLTLAGLPTRIEAVQVVGERFAGRAKLARLLEATRRFLRRRDPSLGAADGALERVRIRGGFFGTEYARPTPAAQAAMARFAAASGARTDSAYSGQALACLYEDLDRGRLAGRRALFWHTFNARRLPPGVVLPAAQGVPASWRRYFAT